MIIVPVSFNGTSLQSTDFTASYPSDNEMLSPSVSPQYVDRAGAFPVLSGSNFNSTNLALEVLCASPFMTTFETLVKVFNVEDETPRQLIVKDTTTTDEPQYSVYAIPRTIVGGNDGDMARITLSLDSPIWESVVQNSQTFATTSATDSTSVDNTGNADAYPIFEITPTSAPADDYVYLRYLQVLPTSASPWNNRFLDVLDTTGGGLDTAALVTAVKMQADGDDLRLLRNKVEIDRQLNGINTTDTHVITNIDMPAARDMTLKTAIGSTDDAGAIVLSYTTANKKHLTAMPRKGRVIIDSSLGSTDTEEFTYTAKTITSTTLSLTANTRAARGTTAVAHAAGSNVRFLPYDLTIIYGNTTVTAPVIDEERKPIQALTSRNNSFVYTNFFDVAQLRSGIWTPIPAIVSDPSRTRSGTYTSTNDEGDTDPSTTIGMKALTFLRAGVSKPDSVTLGWINYFPDGIASVSAVTGEQIQTSSAFPTLSLQSSPSPDSTSFTNLWTVSAQSASDYSTWTTFTKASTDAVVGTGKKYLRWLQSGTITGNISQFSKGGISAMTVGLTNVPHVMIRDEINNFQINCTITNTTTGDSFDLKLPMEINDTVYVDTNPDFPTVTYKGQLVNGAIKLSSTRSAWMKLQPGANTISYDATGGAIDVSIAIKWYTRKRFL